MTRRVALLTEIPAPFRIPLFTCLAEEPEIDLTVLFLRERDPIRPYRVDRAELRFDWRVLPGFDRIVRGRWVIASARVGAALRRVRPDVVILGGWNQAAFWRGLLYARLHRVPAVAWVESTAHDARPRSSPNELSKRLFVRGCSAFLVPGRASADYLRTLDVRAGQIVVAPNAVDLEIFGRRVGEAAAGRAELRDRLGIRRCCFLAVARLAPEKGLDVLLRAAAGLDADVVVAGSGPEDGRLRAAAPANCRFLGQLDRDALVPWYAAADALVLPSRSEPWGMTLNEGAAAGLPLVATDAVGAAYELIEPGVNGFRIPMDDVAALREALERLAADGPFRTAAAARSLELGRRLTPAAWAAAVAGLARKPIR